MESGEWRVRVSGEWRIANCELGVKGESGELGVRVGMICNFNRWFLSLNIIVI
jgi:hypothetical protein